MSTLRYTRLAPITGGCHVARSFYHPGDVSAAHDHDFAEAMWVEIGAVRHDSGRSVRLLTAGDLLLVRPRHHHRLSGVSDVIGVVVNVAVPAAALAGLERRYRCAGLWGAEVEPRVHRLGSEDLAAFGRQAEALRLGPDDILARDAFLLGLLDRLRWRRGDLWHAAPAWLAGAIARCAEPPLLVDGLAALVRLTGRPRNEVERAILATCRLNARSLFAELRLRWAERQLAMSDLPVEAVAAGCGIGRDSLRRLFVGRHGRSPAAYREGCRRASG